MRFRGVDDASALPPLAGKIQPRMIRAAHEFESQMLKELLKPLASAAGVTGDGVEDGSMEVLGDLASEALGRGVVEGGGFGIAERILTQFSRSGNQTGKDAVTGNCHFDTSMRSS